MTHYGSSEMSDYLRRDTANEPSLVLYCRPIINPNLYCYSWEKDAYEILFACKSRLMSRKERRVLCYLVKLGCPARFRKMFWISASGALSSMLSHPTYYYDLLNSFPKYPNPNFNQIELDLHRTFSERSSRRMKSRAPALRNILSAYVKRNPSIGYCQGVNFIAAHLLNIMNEEESFWTLCAIIENILPLDYYSSMLGVIVDQKIYSELVKKLLPSLSRHFEKYCLDSSLVSLQWFICIFTYNLLPSVSDTLWDYLFVHGSKILFRGALAILSLIEKNLMMCKDFSELFILLEKEPKNFCNVSSLIQTMSLTKFKFITNSYLQKLRENKRPSVLNELFCEERQKISNTPSDLKYAYLSRLGLYNAELKHSSPMTVNKDHCFVDTPEAMSCDSSWPICLYDHTFKLRAVSYIVLRSLEPTPIFENYFSVNSNSHAEAAEVISIQKRNEKEHQEAYNKLLIERSSHYCNNDFFVKKLNSLLKLEITPEGSFPEDLVTPKVAPEHQLDAIMKEFIGHIINIM